MDDRFATEGSLFGLCLKCSQTRVIAAHAVMSKGITPEVVRFVARDISNMGHMRVVLQRARHEGSHRTGTGPSGPFHGDRIIS